MIDLNILCNNLDIQNSNQNISITGLNTLKNATKNEVSFLDNKKYLKDLQETKAKAVFVKKEFQEYVPDDTIPLFCPNPYLALAKASKYFAKPINKRDGKKALLRDNVSIDKNVYLGINIEIGENTTIMHGAYIGDDVKIGSNCIIYPNVTIYADCKIGNEVIIHANSVIGRDGFGFANDNGKYVKIYQNGDVQIGNDVEIGSNTSIDRAAFNSTVIEDGVRIDNLIQIGHNCKVSKGCIIVSQSGLAGSTILNEYVIMGAQSGTSGHLEIAPFTTLSARAGVTKNITKSKKQWAGFPIMEHRLWMKLQIKISKLLKH